MQVTLYFICANLDAVFTKAMAWSANRYIKDYEQRTNIRF